MSSKCLQNSKAPPQKPSIWWSGWESSFSNKHIAIAYCVPDAEDVSDTQSHGAGGWKMTIHTNPTVESHANENLDLV